MENMCNLTEGAITSNHVIREAISIQVDKIYDSCKQKECCEDLRVWFCPEKQALANEATSVKVKKAELIWVSEDIEPVTFNRGYYSVDLKYFFNVKIELKKDMMKPIVIDGLATYDKKVILFGSEGDTKSYTSKMVPHGIEHTWKKNDLPKVVVQTMDPVALGAKLKKCKKHHKHHIDCECEGEDKQDGGNENYEPERNINIPDGVKAIYGGDMDCRCHGKEVLVTVGLFSIIKIMRSVQALIPSYGYMPIKECDCGREGEPCSLFSRLQFPSNEFFPPEKKKFPKYEAYPSSTKDDRIPCR